MPQTTASSPQLVLSSTSWLDGSNTLRKFCDTRLSINQQTTRRWNLRDDLMQFPQLGVCGIGLWRWKLDEYEEEQAIQQIRRSGLRPTSLSFAGGFAGFNGMTTRESLQDAAAAIRLARRAGCKVLLVTTGERGDHVRPHVIKTTRYALRKLADYAARRGVRLALMPMRPQSSYGLSMISSLDEAMELVASVNHPAVGLAFHTYHLGHEPDVLAKIPQIAPYVFSVQISDDAGSPGPFAQQRPGQGNLPLEKIVGAFDKAGYRGAFELNIWSERLWMADYSTVLADSVRYLHEHVLQPVAATT